MLILAELKRLLFSMDVSSVTSIQFMGRTIPSAFTRRVFLFSWLAHMVVEYLNCVEGFSYGIPEFLIALHICLMSVYTFITGVSLIYNSSVVFGLFEFMEDVINRSEFFMNWKGKISRYWEIIFFEGVFPTVILLRIFLERIFSIKKYFFSNVFSLPNRIKTVQRLQGNLWKTE